MIDPFNQFKRIAFFLLVFSLLLYTLFVSSTRAHDNNTKTLPPMFYYPSAAVYGFVGECWKTMEGMNHPITNDLWPDEVQTVCGCVLDQMRTTIPWPAFRDSWGGDLDPVQSQMAGMWSNYCILRVLELKEKGKLNGS